MKKPIHVTIDYPDDMEEAGKRYSRCHIEQTMAHFKALGMSSYDTMLAFRGFNAYAEAFRKESEAHEK